MIDAKEYAKALLLLSEERGTTDAVAKDAECALAALKENPAYRDLCDTPALPTAEKLTLIDEAFSAVDRDLISLLKILCEKHEFSQAKRVLTEYLAAVDELRGITRVVAITAVPMSENQKNAMIRKLNSMTGKQILLENRVDPKVLGGVTLRYLGVQLDGTLKTRLDTLERQLRSVIV